MTLLTKGSLTTLGLCLTLTNAGCTGSSSTQASLDPRFSTTGSSVQFVQDGASAMSDVSAQASALSLSVALSVNAPLPSQTGGTQVYAADLKVAGNRVMTAYNVPGDVQKGWVDYIDVTTLAIPLLVSSTYFPDTDINSLAMQNGNFALVGAKQDVGPVLRTGTYGLTGISVNATETPMTSYAGTGAAYDGTGTKLALTSGDNGDVSVRNAATLATIASSNLSDARGVTYHAGTNKFFAVKGQTGEVHSYDVNGNHLSSVALGGATIAQSKSTIVAGSTFLLATTGNGGFSVICASDLGVAATQAQYIAPGNVPDSTLTVSNAAAFGPGMIFVAAGQAGVRVYNFTKKTGTSPTACQNVQVSYMGYFEFSSPLSANNLVYANILTTIISYTGVLYVAEGGGGFKAVTVTATRNSGSDLIEF